MSKPKPDPKLCHHKGRGLYFVRLAGQTFYLGTDRPAAERKRLQLLLDWKSSGGVFTERPPQDLITVAELAARYLAHCKAYYSAAPESAENIAAVFKPFLAVFGSMPAAEFGPRALKSYRGGLCDDTLTRGTVNKKVKILRRAFTWGASEELIPPSVPQALACVEGLRAGRVVGVKEGQPVRAVRWEHVEATLPYLPAPVANLMRLCWHTGARIGEVIGLHAADIDQTGPVWTATLKTHKTAYQGRQRVLCFGKQAQAVLRPAMLAAPLGRVLFSPLDSVAERADAAPGHRREDQQETPRQTDRTVGEVYDPRAVCRAVTRAIAKCNADPDRKDLPEIPHWHPHMCRHSFATRARATMGIEAARVALGHADADITLTYAEADTALAAQVAARLG